MLEAASPWAGSLDPTRSGGSQPPRCTIREIRGHTHLQLSTFGARPDQRALAILSKLGCRESSPQPGDLAGSSKLAIATIGPDRHHLVARSLHDADLAELEQAFAVTDLSHAQCGLRIAGQATAVLRKGLKVNLDLAQWPPLRAVRTSFHHVGVLVLRWEAEMFDLYVSRSFAVSFWDALSDAALEQGWVCADPIL